MGNNMKTKDLLLMLTLFALFSGSVSVVSAQIDALDIEPNALFCFANKQKKCEKLYPTKKCEVVGLEVIGEVKTGYIECTDNITAMIGDFETVDLALRGSAWPRSLDWIACAVSSSCEGDWDPKEKKVLCVLESGSEITLYAEQSVGNDEPCRSVFDVFPVPDPEPWHPELPPGEIDDVIR